MPTDSDASNQEKRQVTTAQLAWPQSDHLRLRLDLRVMFAPVRHDPDAGRVRRITFVPFLEDGQCALISGAAGPALPSGEVQGGEDYLFDTVLRVPLETAGFRYQRFRSFGLDGDHLYCWIEGAQYRGNRSHVSAELTVCSAEDAAGLLTAAGQPVPAAAVIAAAESYRSLPDEVFYSDNVRRLETSYLRAGTDQGGSGFGGDAEDWRNGRLHITDGITRGGSFLDVGCANGLLMESVANWCAERGFRVEPYGVDLSSGLVDLARRRLPQWADRIWVGNAIDWRPPDGLRFDYVHILLDCVPRARRAELIRHQLERTCRPGTGRLLVSQYGSLPGDGGTAADVVRSLGFTCAGESRGSGRPGYVRDPTAWVDAPRAS
jgi:SAM-dependent methyltransferase